jgi:3-phytase
MVAIAVLAVPAAAVPLPGGTELVRSNDETTPSSWSGDSVDDPAIWVNPANPAASLVIGNNKKGALEVYDLNGDLRQKITTPTGFWGNVDVRGDYVTVAQSGVLVYRVIDPTGSAPLQPARESSGNATTGGEGLCLYDPGATGPVGGLYVINIQRSTFRVRVHPLTDTDNDGQLTVGKHTRQFNLASEGEGCVIDDATGYLYMSEEDIGIWRFDLPASGNLNTSVAGAPPRVQIGALGQNLASDVEGLTLTDGYLIASSQNVSEPWRSWFAVYDTAQAGTAHVKNFRVADGETSDDCDQTDGVAAYAGNLGPKYPTGIFICQDGTNQNPKAFQDFKLVRWDALGLS